MTKLEILFCAFIVLFSTLANAEDINVRIHQTPNLLDYNVIGQAKPYSAYAKENQQQNLQNEYMYQQIQNLRIQNQAQQTQQLPDQRMQLFAEAADRIDVGCQEKRESGEYKTFLATNQQCTTPKVIGLAEQMAIPNMDFIYQIMQYSESLARKIDNKEITQEQAYQLLNNFNAN